MASFQYKKVNKEKKTASKGFQKKFNSYKPRIHKPPVTAFSSLSKMLRFSVMAKNKKR